MGGGMGGGMHSADRPSRGVGRALVADLTAKRPKPNLKKVLPEVLEAGQAAALAVGGLFCPDGCESDVRAGSALFVSSAD